MRNRDFLADWPGRQDKALKPGLSRLKRDVWYAYSISPLGSDPGWSQGLINAKLFVSVVNTSFVA